MFCPGPAKGLEGTFCPGPAWGGGGEGLIRSGLGGVVVGIALSC